MDEKLAEPRLVGRLGEIRFVTGRIAEAASFRGSTILIRGDAGIGKSRLLSEIGTRPRKRPFRFASASCYEYLQTPFGPISDLLALLIDEHSVCLIKDPDAREIVNALSSGHASADSLDRFDKRQVFRGIRVALESLVAIEPTVVAIDDLHWADSSTLDLLAFLAEASAKSGLVLIGTYRSSESDQSDAFRRSLARLSRGSHAFVRSLDPLSPQDIRELLHARSPCEKLTGRLISAIVELAEGNPLFAEELLKSALEDSTNLKGDLPLPVSVREAILARYADLDETEQRVVSCAAVVGRKFAATLLAQTLDFEMEAVLSSLDRARQLQLIDAVPDGVLFQFKHDLSRRAIYEQLLPAEARLMHGRIARSMETATDEDSRLPDLAYHYWMAADLVKASDFNQTAGDRAFNLFAYRDALVHYDRVKKSAAGERSERLARVDERCGRCLYQVGESTAALAAYESARSYYVSCGNREDAARLCVWIATAKWSEGHDLEGISECRRALDLVGEESIAFFRAHAFLGHFMLHRDRAEAFEHFAQAERYTGPRADEDSLVFHQCRGNALATRGDIDGAICDFRRATDIVLQKQDYSRAINELGNLGLHLANLGERERSHAAFDEAERLMQREHVWDVNAAVCLRQYAWASVQFGDLREARRLIKQALTFDLDSPRLKCFAAQAAITVGVRALDNELVEAFDGRQLIGDALEPGNESMLATALAFVERDIALGRDQPAKELLHQVVDGYRRVDGDRDDDGSLLIVARHASDEDASTARAFVARFFEETGAVVARAHLLLYDALVAVRRREAEAGRRFALEASDLYKSLRWQWHEGWALEVAGKQRRAMEAFETAGDERARQRLFAALNPKNRQGRTPTQLTSRERDVARLVAAGMSNREIANQLSLSARTVETHVAALFAKLSLRTRAQLIARLRDQPTEIG